MRANQFVAISLGVVLAVFAAVGLLRTLTVSHRDSQGQSTAEKLALIFVNNPQVIWDADLNSYGFPQSSFDSPYLDYTAPITVAL